MEKKTNPGGPGAVGGKGFFIVLILCAAVIGVSAWVLLSDNDTVEEASAVDTSGAIVTMLPQGYAEEAPVIAVSTAKPVPEAVEKEDVVEPAAEEEPEPEVQPVFNETVTTYVWPVRGSVEVPYAMETLLYDATMADWRTHDGIDIACTMGDEVIASAGGTVVRVQEDDMFGTTVEIDHANGIHTVYANLAAEPPVGEGDVVTMGQIIGSVGGTALAETNEVPHLHFAVRLDGHSADPLAYLDDEYLEEE